MTDLELIAILTFLGALCGLLIILINDVRRISKKWSKYMSDGKITPDELDDMLNDLSGLFRKIYNFWLNRNVKTNQTN